AVQLKLTIAGHAWQEITVTLPIQGEAGIIRLYLPAEKSAVELQSIRFMPTDVPVGSLDRRRSRGNPALHSRNRCGSQTPLTGFDGAKRHHAVVSGSDAPA